jgi:4-amino-4-deoxy-L-arabinose transferase-like glycosyltransferase
MYWLGCFAAGLGVITKGVGVIALLMLIPYAVMRARQWPGLIRTQGDGWRWAGGAVAFLLAIATWLVPMLVTAYGLRTPEYLAYVQDILLHQTADRYASSWLHEEDPWFFLLVILRLWVPTWLLIPFLIPRWREALRLRESRVWMPLVWFMLVLVFFSIPSGKRAIYLLPGLPMLALAMAPYIGDLMKTRWLPRLAFGITVASGVVFASVGAWAWKAAPKAARRIAEGYELPDNGQSLWLCVIAVGVAFLVAAAVCRPRRGALALVLGVGLAWIVWPVMTYPLLNANQSAVQLMSEADARIGPDGQLGLVSWREEVLYQARRPVAEFGFTRDAALQMVDARAWQRADPTHRWILLNEDALDSCVIREKVVDMGIANRVHSALLPGDGSKADCVPKVLSSVSPQE